jgi:hypothetical protein
MLLLLLVATYELGRRPFAWSEARVTMVDLAIVSLPVGLLFFLKPGGETGGGLSFRLGDTWLERLGSVTQQDFNAPAWILLCSVAALFLIGVWRNKIKIHPSMHKPLIVLSIVAICMPDVAMGGAFGHLRVPAFVAALLFASSDIRLPQKWSVAIAIGTLVALGWLSTSVAIKWRDYDKQIAEFRAALEQLPPGSRLITATGSNLDRQQLYWHIAEFAIIDRSAFTTQMFATSGQHIVYLKSSMAPFAARSSVEGVPPPVSLMKWLAVGGANNFKTQEVICQHWRYLLNFDCNFDTLLLVHGKGKPREDVGMRLRHEGSFFSLYDIPISRVCQGGARLTPRTFSQCQNRTTTLGSEALSPLP